MTLILGFESSCDETAVALVADGVRVISERVASQADVFAEWGGVVPEIAARGHVGYLPGLIDQVLSRSWRDWCRPRRALPWALGRDSLALCWWG